MTAITEKINHLVSKDNIEKILDMLQMSKKDTVFISGSIIQGIGNKYSDIDVFVIVDDTKDYEQISATYSGESNKLDFAHIGTIGIDIEYWSRQQIESILAMCHDIDTGNIHKRVLNQFSNLNAGLLHRMIIGIGIYNEKQFTRWKDNINRVNYFWWLENYHINAVDNMYEDLIGNLDNENFLTCYQISNEMMLVAIYAYLAHKQVTTDRIKWVLLLLQKLSEEDKEAQGILNTYEKLAIYPQLQSENNLKNNIEERIDFINDLVTIVQKK